MVTLKSILQSIGTQRVADACGIARRTVQSWPKRGIPEKYIPAVSQLAYVPLSIVKAALLDGKPVPLQQAETVAKYAVEKWGRGTESKLEEIIVSVIMSADEAGYQRGRNEK